MALFPLAALQDIIQYVTSVLQIGPIAVVFVLAVRVDALPTLTRFAERLCRQPLSESIAC